MKPSATFSRFFLPLFFLALPTLGSPDLSESVRIPYYDGYGMGTFSVR